MEPVRAQPTTEGEEEAEEAWQNAASVSRKTPWQLALKIQKTRQQRNRRWKISESAQVCWLESHSKALLFHGIRTMRHHRHLLRGWRETMICHEERNRCSDRGHDDSHEKDIITSGHQVPEAVREVQLVRAPHGAVVPQNPELTVQLELVPLGTGLLRTKVQLWSSHHGAGLPRIVQLELIPERTRLPQTKHSGHCSSGSHTSKSGAFRPWDFHLRQGRFFCHEVQSSWSWLWEPDYRWQLSWSGLSELDYRPQSGSHFLRETDVLWQVSGH